MMGGRRMARLRMAVVLACIVTLVLNSPLVFQGAAVRAAGGSTLSLDPATGTFGIDQTFRVNVTLNTNGEAINAVEADLLFPADKLDVIGLDYTTGGCLTMMLDHSYDNAAGYIRLAGGVPSPGFAGAAGHVVTVTFHTKAAGTAPITFDATCAALRNSDNVNVLTGTQPGQFTIAGGASAPGGLVISPAALSCVEGGTVGFGVSLAGAPAANVSVTFIGDPQISVSPSSLMFAPETWNVAQPVLVTAADDATVQGTRSVAIRIVVDSADTVYRGLAVSPVMVAILDNDVAPTGHVITASVTGTGGTISPAGSVAVEHGGTVRFVLLPFPGYEISTVTVDGVAVAVWDRSALAYDFTAVTADHVISCTFCETVDTVAPTLKLVGLDPEDAPRAVTMTMPWSIAVQASDDRGSVTVSIAEGSTVLAQTPVTGKATISVTVPDGEHRLVVSAVDGAGNRTSREVQLVVDTAAPVIALSQVPTTCNTFSCVISGHVADAVSGVASLAAGGSAVFWSQDGSFTHTVPLSKGANKITIEAEDKLGNKTSQTITISCIPVLTVVLRIGGPVMTIDGRQVSIDTSGGVAPIIQNGRTLLPVRALIEALGGSVDWDAASRKATIRLKAATLQLWAGKPTATVNGRTKPIDAKDKKVMPVIVQGRTLLPLRFVAENLGLDLVWNAAQRTITLRFEP